MIRSLLAILALVGCASRVDYTSDDTDPVDTEIDDTDPGTDPDPDTDVPEPTWIWDEVEGASLVDISGPPLVSFWDIDQYGSTVVGLDGTAVWVSQDDGRSWTRHADGEEGWTQARSVEITAQGIFVSTYYSVARSADGGLTWVPADDGLSLARATLVSDGATLLAKDDYGEVAVWTGAGWSDVVTPGFGTVAVSGSTWLYVVPWLNDVYESTDAGATWTQLATGSVGNLDQDTFARTGVLVGTEGFVGTDVKRSDDGGRTWTTLGTGPAEILSVLLRDETLFARTRVGGVFSSDDGATWTDVSAGLPPGLARYTRELLVAGDGDLLLASYGPGAWRSDTGTSWTASSHGLSGGTPTALLPDDHGAVAAFGSNQLYGWDRETGAWTEHGPALDGVYQITTAVRDGEGIVVHSAYDGVLRFEDDVWTEGGAGLPEFNGSAGPQPLSIPELARYRDALWAAHSIGYEGSAEGGSSIPVGGGVSVSYDGGASWDWATWNMPALGQNSWGQPYYPAVASVGAWRDVVLAGTAQNGVLWSADEGGWWKAGTGIARDTVIRGLARVDDTVWAGGEGLGTSGTHGVWRSDDLGRTWVADGEGLPDAPVRDLVAADGALFVLLGGDAPGIWRGRDGVWSLFVAAPAGVQLVAPLAVRGDLFLVGTLGRGVWRVTAAQ